MTTTQLQLRRDTTANVQAITPAQGEPVYDVTRKALVLGDGTTPGGLAATPYAGTWTPQLQFAGANTGMTASTATGSWVQIGPLLFATFSIVLTAKGSATGAATIAGLPLPAADPGHGGQAAIDYFTNLATSPAIMCNINNGASAIALGKSGATSFATLADTDFTDTTTLQGWALYLTAWPAG